MQYKPTVKYLSQTMWSVLFNNDLVRMNIAVPTAGNRNTRKLSAEGAVSLHAYEIKWS